MNTSHHQPRLEDRFLTRRDFLCRCGLGFGMMSLVSLLPPGAVAATASSSIANSPLVPKSPHFPAKAKRIIHIFANGGPSHVDTFDPKPALQKWAGKMLPMANLSTERRTGAALASPFKFQKYGQSGIEVSELFAHTAETVDEICV